MADPAAYADMAKRVPGIMFRPHDGKHNQRGRMVPRTDSNGNEYVTLTSGGVKLEGEAAVRFMSAAEAWDAYWKSLINYLANAVLVEIRELPELNEYAGKFWVRSRLSVVKYHG